MARLSRIYAPAAALCFIAGGAAWLLRPEGGWLAWLAGLAGLALSGLHLAAARTGGSAGRKVLWWAGPLALLCLFFWVGMFSLGHRWRSDLTGEGLHTLAPQTVRILKSLHRPVLALAFFQREGKQARAAQRLLADMAMVNPRFTFRLIDPDTQPAQAQLHGVRGYGTVVLQYSGRTGKVTPVDEQTMANGLLRLIDERRVKVLFTTGHGEHPLSGGDQTSLAQAVEELKEQGYETGSLNLLTAPALNAGDTGDAGTVVVMAGPKARFAPQELDLLKKFMASGGRMMILLDPLADPGLDGLLASAGIKAQETVILDKSGQKMGTEPFVVVTTKYPVHPLIGRFDLAAFFPWARSLAMVEKRAVNLAVSPVVRTSAKAWAETDLDRLKKGEAEQDERDPAGPLNLALASEAAGPEPGSPAGEGFRLVVFGDSDFAANAHFNLVGNGDLFLQSVAWLARRGNLITIKARVSEAKPAFLSARAASVIFWLPVAALPGLVFLIGLAVVWRRRYRA